MPGILDSTRANASYVAPWTLYRSNISANDGDPAIVTAIIDLTKSFKGVDNEIWLTLVRKSGSGTVSVVLFGETNGSLAALEPFVSTQTDNVDHLGVVKLSGLLASKYRVLLTGISGSTWDIHFSNVIRGVNSKTSSGAVAAPSDPSTLDLGSLPSVTDLNTGFKFLTVDLSADVPTNQSVSVAQIFDLLGQQMDFTFTGGFIVGSVLNGGRVIFDISGNIHSEGSITADSNLHVGGSIVITTDLAIGGDTTSSNWNITLGGSATFSDLNVLGSKNFLIPHPLGSSKEEVLRHSSVEAPRADLIYRGQCQLVNGHARVSIDEASNLRIGTFAALTRRPQAFVQNKTGWDPVKIYVDLGWVVIDCKNPSSDDTVGWMVVAERNDPNYLNSPSMHAEEFVTEETLPKKPTKPEI